MKKEYIERSGLLATLALANHPWVDFEDAYEIVQNAPAADVVEVVHGKWVLEREPNGKPYCFHCSACDGDFHYIGIVVKYDYCPNCGAKMDGGKLK